MNVAKAIKELERLGYKVIPPLPNKPQSNFADHSPRVQEALRNTIKNGLF